VKINTYYCTWILFFTLCIGKVSQCNGITLPLTSDEEDEIYNDYYQPYVFLYHTPSCLSILQKIISISENNDTVDALRQLNDRIMRNRLCAPKDLVQKALSEAEIILEEHHAKITNNTVLKDLTEELQKCCESIAADVATIYRNRLQNNIGSNNEDKTIIAENLIGYEIPEKPINLFMQKSTSDNLITVNANGNVTIAAPDAGVCLTIAGGGLVSNGPTQLTSLSTGVMSTDGSGNVTSTLTPTVNSITISNSPVAPTDGANKAYADLIAAGMDFKNSCFAATTANLNATYNNGAAGVGATLTNAGAMAAFTTDGTSPGLNDRILVKNQASSFQNGIYEVTVVGDGVTNWVLTRTTDYDTAAEISSGNITAVINGTLNGDTLWLQTENVTTVGTDPILWISFITQGINVLIGNVGSATGDMVTVAGGSNISTSGAGSTLTMSVSGTTDHAVQVGNASGSLTSLTVGTNGQVLLGATGADPAFRTPTAGTGLTLTSNSTTLQYALTTPVSVANGGTGATSFTSNGVLYGNGTSAVQVTAAGAANTVLLGNGGIPSFGSVPNAATTGTSSNTPNTLVLRDGAGSFSAQVITHAAGTAATPSVTFTGSTATGLSAAVADTLVVSTAGTSRMSINPSGNITMNAPSAGVTLAITGDAATAQTITAGANNSGLSISGNGTANAATITAGSGSGGGLLLTGGSGSGIPLQVTAAAGTGNAATFTGNGNATAVSITAGTGRSALSITGSTTNPAVSITGGGGGGVSITGAAGVSAVQLAVTASATGSNNAVQVTGNNNSTAMTITPGTNQIGLNIGSSGTATGLQVNRTITTNSGGSFPLFASGTQTTSGGSTGTVNLNTSRMIWANITAGGVVTLQSGGITSVTNPSTGNYVVTYSAFGSAPFVSVTPNNGSTASTVSTTVPTTTSVTVSLSTLAVLGGNPTNMPFTILIIGPAT
jgi:hypothetical protein